MCQVDITTDVYSCQLRGLADHVDAAKRVLDEVFSKPVSCSTRKLEFSIDMNRAVGRDILAYAEARSVGFTVRY